MPPISLQIPAPCAESWEAMTPTGLGRHCAACQQVVVDFTGMTDGELVAYLGRAAAVPCGRFRESQLGRVLLPAAAPVAGWRRWWGAVAALLGLGVLAVPARAQATPGKLVPPAKTQPVTHTTQPAQPTTNATCASATQAVTPPERILAGAPLMGRPVLPPAKSTKAKAKSTKR